MFWLTCEPPRPNMVINLGQSARGIMPRAPNTSMGTATHTPTDLPRRRWKYSQKKIFLNSSSCISRLSLSEEGIWCIQSERSRKAREKASNFWNSGNCLYLPNSSSHSAVSNGGRILCGFHSTIESPEFVRRVVPPTTTMANTNLVEGVGVRQDHFR